MAVFRAGFAVSLGQRPVGQAASDFLFAARMDVADILYQVGHDDHAGPVFRCGHPGLLFANLRTAVRMFVFVRGDLHEIERQVPAEPRAP